MGVSCQRTTKSRLRQSYANLLSRMANAPMETPALLPMEKRSFRKRSTCLQDTRRSCANSSTRTVLAHMETDANSSTRTWLVSWWRNSTAASRILRRCSPRSATAKLSTRMSSASSRGSLAPPTLFWMSSISSTKTLSTDYPSLSRSLMASQLVSHNVRTAPNLNMRTAPSHHYIIVPCNNKIL